jgi:hypothetical protein
LAECRELDRALNKLRTIVIEGVNHGYFDCTITCEMVGGRKRKLIIKGGKSEQFTIPAEDLGE